MRELNMEELDLVSGGHGVFEGDIGSAILIGVGIGGAVGGPVGAYAGGIAAGIAYIIATGPFAPVNNANGRNDPAKNAWRYDR